MEQKNEVTEGKGKVATYVRWFFVGAFGLIILFTVFMAAYRKVWRLTKGSFLQLSAHGDGFLVDFPQIGIFFGQVELVAAQSPDIDKTLDHSEEKQC